VMFRNAQPILGRLLNLEMDCFRNFIGFKAIKSHKPIGLIQSVFTNQRYLC
jgi:hypothetical protein